ncbi:MAG: hypothetical protein KY460_00685 [Actinobacteria bacterium]|nr:hypothetical protein [Actinomycetota bacterium]
MDAGHGVSGAHALLRQLARGLSAYRLYPGDLTQPAFQGAVERIRDAAGTALGAGPAEALVRAGRFHVDDHEVIDEAADRLAEACFSRRVEYVRIDRPPTVDELDAFYEVLGRDPEDVTEAGGVAALLDARGVGSITALAGAPETDAVDGDHDESDPEAALPVLALLPGDTASSVYDRLRGAQETLDEVVSARSSFYRRAAGLVAGLDEQQQAAFGSLVLDRMQTDAFAERYAGHLADPEIAELLARAARFRGVEPVEVAVEFVRISARQQTLVAVVRDFVSGDTLDGAPDGSRIAHAAADLRDAFPSDAADGRRLALLALADYLRCDVSSEQLERVVGAVTRQLRAAVGDGDGEVVRELLDTLDAARPDVDSECQDLLAAPRHHALTPHVLRKTMRARRAGSEGPAEVLRPFGTAAIDALVAALASDERSDRRVIATLAALARDRPRILGRHIDHERWHVVRDLAKVLVSIGGPATAAPLVALAGHDHPTVRHEALHGLTKLPPADSAAALARAVPVMRTRAEQRDGLDALAACDAPQTPALLRDLASSRGSHALPWLMRRRARRLARRSERP